MAGSAPSSTVGQPHGGVAKSNRSRYAARYAAKRIRVSAKAYFMGEERRQNQEMLLRM